MDGEDESGWIDGIHSTTSIQKLRDTHRSIFYVCIPSYAESFGVQYPPIHLYLQVSITRLKLPALSSCKILKDDESSYKTSTAMELRSVVT